MQSNERIYCSSCGRSNDEAGRMLEKVDNQVGAGPIVPYWFLVVLTGLCGIAPWIRYVAGTRWGTRKYLDMTRLEDEKFESRAQQNGEFILTQ